MAYKFSKRSLGRMKGLHPDIVSVMELAISRSSLDFTVLEGMRTLTRQRQLFASGASKTMNSRHLTGHAIDIAPYSNGSASWDWPLYHKLAPIVKQAAEDLGVDLEWGGDWVTFKDGPHWQLSWSTYPKGDMTPRAQKPAKTPPAFVPPDVEPAPAVVPVQRPSGLLAWFRGLWGR